MGSAVLIRCGENCKLCPVLPLSRTEYRDLVSIYKNNANKSQREFAHSVLSCKTVKVGCTERQKVVWVTFGD